MYILSTAVSYAALNVTHCVPLSSDSSMEKLKANGASAIGKWRFAGNKDLHQASPSTTRSILTTLIDNLDSDESKSVILLGYGDPSPHPSFAITPIAEDAISAALRSAEFNGYPPSAGIPKARRAVAEYLSKDLPYTLSAEDVYLTIGCTQAMEAILTAVICPKSNILLPKPGYPYYEARCDYEHIEIRHYNLLPENGWEVDLVGVEALADENTIAMVIINPGNPCGNAYKYEHLKKVAEMARKLGILLISDEVYAHLTFGNTPFVPLGVFRSIAPIITIGSISKRWAVPGWRIGWLVAYDPDGVLAEQGIIESIKGFMDISPDPTTFVQGALPRMLEDTQGEFLSKIVNNLRVCADICYDLIKDMPSILCLHKPEASLSTMVKLDLPLLKGIEDDLDFCLKLAKEESVVILPGIAVGLKNWVRITFAVEPSSLEEGLRRMKVFCKRHTSKSM